MSYTVITYLCNLLHIISESIFDDLPGKQRAKSNHVKLILSVLYIGRKGSTSTLHRFERYSDFSGPTKSQFLSNHTLQPIINNSGHTCLHIYRIGLYCLCVLDLSEGACRPGRSYSNYMYSFFKTMMSQHDVMCCCEMTSA